MIKFCNVDIVRGNKSILENVSFTVSKGEKCVITGSSGCGKTSLLLAVMGFCSIPKGILKINGTELTIQTLNIVRSQIAYISQEPVLGSGNVLEAIMLPFGFKANKNIKPEISKIKETLGKFGLSNDILNKRCVDVSGGEKQRIVIARAFLMNKSIFMADEVTTGLDTGNASIVRDFLGLPDLTVLSVSHDPFWIEKQQSVYKIENGKLMRV